MTVNRRPTHGGRDRSSAGRLGRDLRLQRGQPLGEERLPRTPDHEVGALGGDVALMAVDARISQMTYLPTWALSQSMARESLSKPCMSTPL